MPDRLRSNTTAFWHRVCWARICGVLLRDDLSYRHHSIRRLSGISKA